MEHLFEILRMSEGPFSHDAGQLCSTKNACISNIYAYIFMTFCTDLLKTLFIAKQRLKSDHSDQQPRQGRGC